MIKTILNIIFLLLLSSNLYAIEREMINTDGGDHIGNGGGLSESNFAFARIHLNNFIKLCLDSTQCLSTTNEKTIAKNVLGILDEELKQDNQIIVLSGNQNPGFFFLDNNIRVAKTARQVGSPIYLNRDLLYVKKGKRLSTIDIPQAVGILFHEYGHHTGENNHDLLDSIGAKIGLNAAKESYTLSSYFNEVHLPRTKDPLLQTISFIQSPGQERLVLKGKNLSLDLTDRIKRELIDAVEESCSPSTEICSDLVGVKEGTYAPQSIYFSAANWEKTFSPTLDGRFIWIKLTLDIGSYKSIDPTSSYYHLKAKAFYLIKLDRLKLEIKETIFNGLEVSPFFGVTFKKTNS